MARTSCFIVNKIILRASLVWVTSLLGLSALQPAMAQDECLTDQEKLKASTQFRLKNIATVPDDATLISIADISPIGLSHNVLNHPSSLFINCSDREAESFRFFSTGDLYLINDTGGVIHTYSSEFDDPNGSPGLAAHSTAGGTVAAVNFGTLVTDAASLGARSVGSTNSPSGTVVGYNGPGTGGTQGGSIKTFGPLSHGMSIVSIGGDGSDGISSSGNHYAVGGSGSSGAHAGKVFINNQGSIATEGDSASGINAMSIGGNGGTGGQADASGFFSSVATGGSGGSGGDGESVDALHFGSIDTVGVNAIGIKAMSVGGGGGEGGTANSQPIIGSIGSFTMSTGGTGGAGGDGDKVNITLTASSSIETGTDGDGEHSPGVLAQSIGGGGGNGGHAVSTPHSTDFTVVSVHVNKGGKGSGGGGSDDVTVKTDAGSKITTSARASSGIVAQSIGGGGGNGGTAMNADFGTPPAGLSVNVGLGGAAGAGGIPGAVAVTADGSILTYQAQSNGIVAQSIAGGGGNGGNVIDSVNKTALVNLSFGVNMGGTGGIAHAGGSSSANVGSDGKVSSYGDHATGLVVQSIGGGGGNGGSVQNYTNITGGGASVQVGGHELPTLVLNANVNLGGEGGAAGDGGNAASNIAGNIETFGVSSAGAHIQSIGGGGGNGGHVYSNSQTTTASSQTKAISATVNVGGKGGGGGAGGAATATMADGAITTHQLRSSGLLVQSIGGSGGNGGVTNSVSFTTSTPPTPSLMVARFSNFDHAEPEDKSSLDITANVGGRGGAGGQGGSTNVMMNGGSITTHGRQSHGLLAQSVGGGGGTGGHAMANGFAGVNTYNFSLSLGGSGGSGNSGGEVNVHRTQSSDLTSVTTHADHSYGVLAQSIGGGGGEGGSAHTDLSKINVPLLSKTAISLTIGGSGGDGGTSSSVEVSDLSANTSGIQSHGVLAQSIGGGGGNATVSNASGSTTLNLGGSGGTGGHGDTVFLQNITANTSGSLAAGIVAQSVGGGGGVAGIAGTNGLLNEAAASTVSSVFNLARSGTNGNADKVTVGCKSGTADANCQTNITTSGTAAPGILAQSIGGGGSSSFLNLGTSGISHVTLKSAAEADSGRVTVTDRNGGSINVSTSGHGAPGIVAQSLAGGGGAMFTDANLSAIGLSSGFGLASGNNGGVDVALENTVTTHGDHAPGVFMQAGHSLYTLFASDGQQTVQEKSGGFGTISLPLNFANNFHLADSGTINTSGKASHGLTVETFSRYGTTADPTRSSNDRSSNIWIDGSISVSGDDSWGVSAANKWDPSLGVPFPTTNTTAFTLSRYASIVASGKSSPGGIRISDTGNVRADINGVIRAGTGTNGTAIDITAANTFLTVGDSSDEWGPVQNYIGDIKVSNTTPTGTNTITINRTVTLHGQITSHAPSGGKSIINMNGTIMRPGKTAIQINELTNNNSSITIETVQGNIMGVADPSGQFTGHTATLTNKRAILGTIGGPFDYHMERGSTHGLKIDAANHGGDFIAVASFSSEAETSISPSLTSLPTSDFKSIEIANISNGQGLSLADFNLDNDQSLVDYTYSAIKNGDIFGVLISDIQIDLNPDGLTGHVAEIAPLANEHVQAIRNGTFTPNPKGNLYKTLLKAANIGEGTDGKYQGLINTLGGLSGTSLDPDTQSSTVAARNAADKTHSCGGAQTASVNPIEQGECVWGSVTTTDVSLDNARHDESSTNFALGRQFEIGEKSYLGFSLGYDDVDIVRSSGHADGERLHVGAIYKYVYGNLFAATSLVGTYSRNDSVRTFSDPFQENVVINARSDREALSLSSRFRGGYRFELGRFDITPKVDVDLFLIRQFQYAEQDAAGLGTFADSTTNLLVDIHPHVQVGSNFNLGEAGFRLYGHVGQRFALNDPILNVGFVDGLAGSSTIEVKQERENQLTSFGFGLIADLSERVEVRLTYDVTDGNTESNELFGFKASLKF